MNVAGHIIAVTGDINGLMLAVVAGVLSFASPCVLPLVPSYVAFVTGASAASVDANAERARIRSFTLGCTFVLGFSLVFIALGATASELGSLLAARSTVIERVGGLLVIVFGAFLLGVIRIPGMHRDTRRMHAVVSNRAASYGTALIIGAAFAAGWSPCIGPVLASILTFAATQEHAAQGVALLGAYSLGLAIPFLIASVAIDRFMTASVRMRRMLPYINRVSGAVMIVVGTLLMTGTMSRMSAWFARFTPGWLQ